MELIKVEDYSIEMKIYFAEPDALTLYIEDPDRLVVKISLPTYIRDAATGKEIEKESYER